MKEASGLRNWKVLSLGVGLSFVASSLKSMAADWAMAPIAPVPIEQNLSPALDPVLPPVTCPEEVELLTEMLLRDLPGYANRVIQRSFTGYRTETRPGTILFAGLPEFDPLSTDPGVYYPVPPDATDPDVEQVFFTLLERQYFSERISDFQSFHWVFLTKAESGWRLAMMFSSFGAYPNAGPSTPPENTSEGAIAQAIELWLRDCRTGDLESR